MDDFDTAFPALHALAYRVAFRLLGVREDSEDIAQEAVARAGVRWQRLTRQGAPDAWVVRVAGRLAIDAWRRRGVRAQYAATARPVAGGDGGPLDRIVLHDHLARLTRRQREVVVLRYIGDLSEAAVADALGCSLGTVKRHASRGLAALRAGLEGAGDVRAS